jgi:acylphosphatase
MKSLRVYISGTVQGILYRKHLEELGNKVGVRGFVRMKEDGKIELVIEGKDEKVKEMLNLVKQGEKHVEIRNVEIEEIRHQGFEGFKQLKL